MQRHLQLIYARGGLLDGLLTPRCARSRLTSRIESWPGSGLRSIPIDNPSQWTTAAWLQLATVAVLVVLLHVPLGDYMARVYADTRHWRLEKLCYWLIGAQPDDRQRWTKY